MEAMEIQIAVSKVNKYAVSESGDTLKIVERPNGGLSVVLADGQTSPAERQGSFNNGRTESHQLARGRCTDGAAARAASDALFTEKGGKSHPP